MSLTKLYLAGIIKLLVSDIPSRNGKIANLFLQCSKLLQAVPAWLKSALAAVLCCQPHVLLSSCPNYLYFVIFSAWPAWQEVSIHFPHVGSRPQKIVNSTGVYWGLVDCISTDILKQADRQLFPLLHIFLNCLQISPGPN